VSQAGRDMLVGLLLVNPSYRDDACERRVFPVADPLDGCTRCVRAQSQDRVAGTGGDIIANGM